jgi:hypothetical protein
MSRLGITLTIMLTYGLSSGTTSQSRTLIDCYQTDTVISHPSVVFYDFYAAWDDPIASDESAYLSKLR